MLSITGTYAHNIDAKGRLFLPTKLQKELGLVFYLTMGIDACLAIYPEESWQVFTEKFALLPMSQSKVMRPIFSNAIKCDPDNQGRIIIPQRLRKYAGLNKEVIIAGAHNRAEIWDAALFRREDDEMTPEKMQALVEQLGF